MRIPSLVLVVLVGLIPLLLFTILLLVPTQSFVAWQPPNNWSNRFGPGPYFQSAVTSIYATTDSVYAGGFLGKPLGSVNSSSSGLFVSRYDTSGRQMWMKLFDSPVGLDYPSGEVHSVSVGNGKIIVAGQYQGSSFAEWYDTNGTALATLRFSTSQQGSDVEGVSQSSTASYAVGYYRASNLTFVHVLESYDSRGNTKWNNTIGLTNSGPRPVAVFGVPDGAYVSSSDTFQGLGTLLRYDENGTLVWTRQLDCSACLITSVSGDGTAVYAAGYVVPSGYSRYFLYRYSFDGTKMWSRQFSTDFVSSTVSMAADLSGIYLAIEGGSSYHPGSILAYDSAGNRVWSFETMGTPYTVSAGGGTLYVGGNTGGPVAGFPGGGDNSAEAFAASFWQSSSLVFLGLNPPFSFGLLATIVAVIVGAVLWYTKRLLKEAEGFSKKPMHMLKGVPADAAARASTIFHP